MTMMSNTRVRVITTEGSILIEDNDNLLANMSIGETLCLGGTTTYYSSDLFTSWTKSYMIIDKVLCRFNSVRHTTKSLVVLTVDEVTGEEFYYDNSTTTNK